MDIQNPNPMQTRALYAGQVGATDHLALTGVDERILAKQSSLDATLANRTTCTHGRLS